MDCVGAGSDAPSCYYSLLGLRRNASPSDIRSAYRRMALKWHPDRWAKDPSAAVEAKRRFQRIQEAYSVLSDNGKRALYDAGLYDPLDDDDQDFSDFMQEMLAMMDSVKNEVRFEFFAVRPSSASSSEISPAAGRPAKDKIQKPDTLEDLQRMLEEIVNGDGSSNCGRTTVDAGRRNHSSAVRR